MNKEKAAEILADKLRDVESAAASVAPDFEERAIHAFRVAVKKLRAFLRLIEAGKGKSKMKLGRRVKKLYDIAGEIRNAQLEGKTIKRQKASLPAYMQKLDDIIILNRDTWQQHYKADTIKKLAKKLNGKHVHKMGAKTFVCFLKEHIKVLEDIADSSPDDERIHTGRKSVKDMLYNTKLAEKHWPKAYAKIAHLPLNKLDHLSDMLGDYNDARLILESQLSFLLRVKHAKEKKALTIISNKEKKAKEEQKQALLKDLKIFVTAAALK